MELILMILGALGASGLFLFFRKRPSEREIEFNRNDAALKALQEEKEEDIEALNKRLQSISERAKKLSPKQAEDFWNDEDNS